MSAPHPGNAGSSTTTERRDEKKALAKEMEARWRGWRMSVSTVRTGRDPDVWAWLDDGLREGLRGRLGAEYPRADGGRLQRVLIEQSGRLLSHAMVEHGMVMAGDRRIPFSQIGLVYTDPVARGEGLGSRCVRRCIELARERGSRLVLLWSDRVDFYARMGFAPGGIEHLCKIDEAVCERALSAAAKGGFEVRRPGGADWDRMEQLYRAKPVHVARPEGQLATAAQIPECEIRVACEGERVIAYAAMGRGNDFPGVVHEWAGNGPAVIACTRELVRQRLASPVSTSGQPAGPYFLTSGSYEEAPYLLRAAGARVIKRSFALIRILEPEALWRTLRAGSPRLERTELCPDSPGASTSYVLRDGPTTRHPLDQPMLLDLAFGTGREICAIESADPELATALRAHFPHPLFVWGFDSI